MVEHVILMLSIADKITKVFEHSVNEESLIPDARSDVLIVL